MLVSNVDREELTVSNSVVTLTASKFSTNPITGDRDIRYADIYVMGANIRVTNNGSTDPVGGTTGALWYAGGTYRVWGRPSLGNLKMIRDGSTDAEVVVEYWGGAHA